MNFLFGVSVCAWVFTVLFTTGVAFIALSSVGSESVFDEGVALAVRAGKGDCDWHDDYILT